MEKISTSVYGEIFYSVKENCESDWEFDKSPLGNKLHKINFIEKVETSQQFVFCFLGAYL